MSNSLISFFQDTFQSKDFIPLHAPTFDGNEKQYVNETIDSTFVSSVGSFVDQFEKRVSAYTRTNGAVATVNGTASLYTALYLSEVTMNDLVITQALTFVATCNSISQLGAQPLFIDVDASTLGLSPRALEQFLNENAIINDKNECIHKATKQRIKAAVPMHTFGHPCQIEQLATLCQQWHITLIEDAAESLGSFYNGQHTGTFGRFGIFSFNGNKIITTGGGGIIVANDIHDIKRAKHVTTTAKTPHPYHYFHDEFGFNYRMPNLNAALGCAQLEMLAHKLTQKRQLALHYQAYFKGSAFTFVSEPENARSNYWLNALICPSIEARDELLQTTNKNGVMTRPVWTLMHKLPMYKNSLKGDLSTSLWLESCLVNIPSSPIDIPTEHII
ncbi:LegC family aminotransferase [Psychrobium sp. nBUS_13]|uniref:LegC family aminotransferase n=1 Tax=Psychrobium sp. nBUS_13 TaxID=3395319 RepID=UPI003EBB9D4A